jgi:hypothetical protein
LSASHPEPDDELLTLYQVAELLYAHPETVNRGCGAEGCAGFASVTASADGASGRRSTSGSDKHGSSREVDGCGRAFERHAYAGGRELRRDLASMLENAQGEDAIAPLAVALRESHLASRGKLASLMVVL